MSSIVERVYVGRADPVDLILETLNEETQVRTRVDFSSFDRMVLVIAAPTPKVIDSTTLPAAIDWSDPNSVGRLRLVLGTVAGIPTSGTYPIRVTAIDGTGKAYELVHEDMYPQSGAPQLKFVATSSLP